MVFGEKVIVRTIKSAEGKTISPINIRKNYFQERRDITTFQNV